MILKPDDAEALRELFAHGAPITAKAIVAATGLDVRELKAYEIVRTLGRWGTDDFLYQGVNFPTATPPNQSTK